MLSSINIERDLIVQGGLHLFQCDCGYLLFFAGGKLEIGVVVTRSEPVTKCNKN